MSIAELAVMDPIAAYGRLLKIPIAPVVFNAIATFSSFALNQIPVRQPLDQQTSRRTWIDNLAFELKLPNVFPGNLFLPQSLKDLKASPGVSVRTTVMSGPRYVVAETFTPIENYVKMFDSDWTVGWQIAKFQTIQTEFMLTAVPFNDPSNAPPYIVTLTYNGWQFMDGTCDDISCEFATDQLTKAGILSPFGGPCAPVQCK
jgi:hypothetical protein